MSHPPPTKQWDDGCSQDCKLTSTQKASPLVFIKQIAVFEVSTAVWVTVRGEWRSNLRWSSTRGNGKCECSTFLDFFSDGTLSENLREFPLQRWQWLAWHPGCGRPACAPPAIIPSLPWALIKIQTLAPTLASLPRPRPLPLILPATSTLRDRHAPYRNVPSNSLIYTITTVIPTLMMFAAYPLSLLRSSFTRILTSKFRCCHFRYDALPQQPLLLAASLHRFCCRKRDLYVRFPSLPGATSAGAHCASPW